MIAWDWMKPIGEQLSRRLGDDELSASISELHLPTRAYNGLIRAGIRTAGDLMQYDLETIRSVKWVGTKSMDDIIGALERYVLEWQGAQEENEECANKAQATPRDPHGEGKFDFLEAFLASLPDRTRRIIKLRYGLEDGRSYTLSEIGEEFGVSRERIRQLETKALARLRHPGYSAYWKPVAQWLAAILAITNDTGDSLSRAKKALAAVGHLRKASVVSNDPEPYIRALPLLFRVDSELQRVADQITAPLLSIGAPAAKRNVKVLRSGEHQPHAPRDKRVPLEPDQNIDRRILHLRKLPKCMKGHEELRCLRTCVNEDPYARAIFQDLRAFRLRTSHLQGVPAYFIFDNRVLYRIALVKPRNLEELREIRGIGSKKLADFGEEVIKIVRRYLRSEVRS